MRIATDQVSHVELSPEELWGRIGRVSEFERWWPWLRRFDGRMLAEGEVWHCVVQPPAPYVVRFTITVGEVVEPHVVRATITGDISGTASLHLEPDGAGTRLRLTAALAPEKRSLRLLSVAARPLVQSAHDWVLDVGLRQFLVRSAEPRPTLT